MNNCRHWLRATTIELFEKMLNTEISEYYDGVSCVDVRLPDLRSTIAKLAAKYYHTSPRHFTDYIELERTPNGAISFDVHAFALMTYALVFPNVYPGSRSR